jgi:hypothetical protein
MFFDCLCTEIRKLNSGCLSVRRIRELEGGEGRFLTFQWVDNIAWSNPAQGWALLCMTVSLATLEAELGGSQSEVSQAKTGDPT